VNNVPPDDDTVVIGGLYDSRMSGSGGTVVAEAITSDDHIAQELREQLRSEIQREIQAQMQATQVITAQVITVTPSTSRTPSTQFASNVNPSSRQGNYREEHNYKEDEDDVKPHCMRKRVRIAVLIAVLFVAAIVAVAVVFATRGGGDDGNNGDVSGAEDPNDGIVGDGTQPIEPTLPGFPIPSPTPDIPPTEGSPTAGLLPNVSLISRQRLEGESNGDQYGEFVVLSRDSKSMAIGASSGDYVQVFQHNIGSWEQVGQTIS
jgi:hypothetical protein